MASGCKRQFIADRGSAVIDRLSLESLRDNAEVTLVEKIRVIQYGMGQIGSKIARLILEKDHLELVGAVDIDPQKAGKDAGLVIGLQEPLGFPVTRDLDGTLQRTQAEVVVHSTSSTFSLFKKQILEMPWLQGWMWFPRPRNCHFPG